MRSYNGLQSGEVEAQRRKYGSNELEAVGGKTFFRKYMENFEDPIIKILLVALGINVLFTFTGRVDWYECFGILLSVLLATFVSTISEYKNENIFKKLKAEASKTLCMVYRDGELTEISTDDLVVGDHVLLQSGNLVPADGHVIDGCVTVDQSALNGESKEVKKSAEQSRGCPDFWDKSSLYRGSVVREDECVMIVDSVGENTVYGNISKEAQTESGTSPLTEKLTELAKSISKFGYIAAILVVIICMLEHSVIDSGFSPALIRAYFLDFQRVTSDFVESVIYGIIVIVVAIPEGLPLMIAIVCSLNMKKMLKGNVLVRRLIGIETAGSMNILFSDKTGTITKGKLNVVTFVNGFGKEYKSFYTIEDDLRDILCTSIVNNTSSHLSKDGVIGGNATEKALLEYVPSNRVERYKAEILWKLPFSSQNKFSAAALEKQSLTLYKGAPEKILPKCTYCYSQFGKSERFEARREIDKKLLELAGKSYRLIALAVKPSVSRTAPGKAEIPDGLILVGLIGIRDDVRPEAKNAIREVRAAGIQVVMITGDKRETAVAIAKEVKLIDSDDDVVLTSDDLDKMSDEKLKELMPRIRVIARARPNDKSRLVRIAREMELVVGMTGDGVNDSPALKQADVGFAMGSGTEVAKEAGDIVILDDNFGSVRNAVLYGRTIYNSIKKFIKFQLAINVAAVSVSIAGRIIGIEKPFSITQMLWINLVMDTLAAIAFGGEPALRRYLDAPPKSRNEKLLDRDMWSSIIFGGLTICAISMFMFVSPKIHSMFRAGDGDIYFYTGYFTFFIFSCIFNGFNARADGIDLIENLAINKQFIWIMGLICAVQIIMTYFGGAILRTAGLSISEWAVALSLAFLIIPLDLARKILFNK